MSDDNIYFPLNDINQKHLSNCSSWSGYSRDKNGNLVLESCGWEYTDENGVNHGYNWTRR